MNGENAQEVEEDQTGGKLSMDTTLFVAGGSLFLYLAASFYLGGYLQSFGCDADWFDPSIFQLITFSKIGILVALFLASGFWWLFELDPFAQGWWILYGLWLLFLLTVTLLLGVAPAMDGVTVAGRWVNIGNGMLFALSPPIVAWFGYRRLHRERRIVEIAQSTKEIGKERVELDRKRRFTIVFMTALTSVFALHYCTICGVVAASMQFVNHTKRAAVAENSADTRIQMLFTDGVRTLSRERRAEVESIVYGNPEADLRLVLRVVSEGALIVPQTRPTTLPGPAVR